MIKCKEAKKEFIKSGEALFDEMFKGGQDED